MCKTSIFAVVLCLGAPAAGFAISGCGNAQLSGTYNARVSSLNFQGILGINNAGGFGNHPSSLSGQTPGMGRFRFDGNGNIVGMAPGNNASLVVGSYSVSDDCSATLQLNSGEKFNAVVLAGGAQVMFIQSDAGSAGAIGELDRGANSCLTGVGMEQQIAFSFSGAQGGNGGGVITDAKGDFLSSYTGPQNGDMDVMTAQATFDGTNFTFMSVEAGKVGTTSDALFVWGVDRGTHTAGFGAFRPGVLFDAVVILRPDGTGAVTDLAATPPASTPLPAGSVTISGNTIRGVVPASMLPSKGMPAASYGVNLWPRTGLGNNAQIADFAPDNSDASVILTGSAASSVRSFSAIGTVTLAPDGTFSMREWMGQNGVVKPVNSTGTFTLGNDCSLTFSNGMRGLLTDNGSGVFSIQPDAGTVILGTAMGQ